MKTVIYILLIIIILGTLFFFYTNERAPATLGVNEGKFTPCPDRPNCINSQSNEEIHRIDPIAYTGSKNPIPLLAKIIKENFPSARVVTENDHYLHVEFRSQFFKFVDDAEYYYEPAKGLIELKSGARVGYYDFDVNRKRAEQIRALFMKATA